MFSNTWREAVFTLYGNGILSRTKKPNGKRKKSINLKTVINSIKIQTVFEYRQEFLAKLSEQNRFLKKFNIFSNSHDLGLVSVKSSTRSTNSINKISLIKSSTSDCELKFDLKEAMLLIIPLKLNSKKNWIFLFSDLEILR
jgi:hypothetical protein